MKKDVFKWLFFNPVGWFVLFGLLAVVVVSIELGFDAFTCSDITAETNRLTKFSVVSGCYVQINNEWVPASRWRAAE